MALLNPEKQAERSKELTAQSKEFKTFSEYTRKRAEAQRARNKIRYDVFPIWEQNIETYRDECYRRNKPMTHAGIALACDISIDSYYRACKGELDYITEEYRLLNGISDEETLITPSSIMQKARLYLQNQLEETCYQPRGANPVGSIFGLKARYGWQDDAISTTTNNTLIVADKDKALSVLDMLKPSDSNG